MRRVTYLCDYCGRSWWRMVAPTAHPGCPPGWTLDRQGADICAMCLAERAQTIEDLLGGAGLTGEAPEDWRDDG